MQPLTDVQKEQIRAQMVRIANDAADKLFNKQEEKGNHRGLSDEGLDRAFVEELQEFVVAEGIARKDPTVENMRGLYGELIDLFNVSFMSYDTLSCNRGERLNAHLSPDGQST